MSVLDEVIKRLTRVDRQITLAQSALCESTAHLQIVINKLNIQRSIIAIKVSNVGHNKEESSSSESLS